MSKKRFPFFDPGKARGGRRGPDVGRDVTSELLAGADPSAGETPATPSPISVSALVGAVKNALSGAFPQRLVVVGEISNLKPHSSGHLYFRLKDSRAAVDSVMFKSAASKLKFRPTDGMEVVVEGRVDVYDVRGQLQFYAESMTPKGAGALELAFQQLCTKLQQEGLFEPSHKVQPPRFPRAVGIITSPTGAAIADIRRTLARRWPGAIAYLAPALVQGEGAAQSVAQAIQLMDASAARYEIDVIIVARGGGSLEDLWAFNEEIVARAIFAARTPIISGVGHEVDVTICDMVADLRAATPTAAAQSAVPDAIEVARHVNQLGARLDRRTRDLLEVSRAQLESVLRSVVVRDPCAPLRVQTQRLDELEHRLLAAVRSSLWAARHRAGPLAQRLAALHPARLGERASARVDKATARLAWVLGAMSKRATDRLATLNARFAAVGPHNRLALAKERVSGLARQLDSLSYRSVLRRGFSVTRDNAGAILRSVGQVKPGMTILTELANGQFSSTGILPVSSMGVPPMPPAPPFAAEPSENGAAAPTASKKPGRKRDDDSPNLFDSFID